MIQEERFTNIINYLEKNLMGKLADFAEINGVSMDTVRRDLDLLEGDGMLKRVRGGAVFHDNDISTGAFQIRDIVHRDEKREIASLLEQVIIDGQSVGINSGTTTTEAARFLADHYFRLTVITNNIHALEIFRKAKGFTVIVPGGFIDPQEGAIFGDKCEEDLSRYNIDVSLLAVNAISAEKGITDFRINEVDIINAMMKVSSKNVVLADYSKFQKIAYMNVCDLKNIDVVISDSKFPAELKPAFERQSVKIITP